jgi:hypothetical protein
MVVTAFFSRAPSFIFVLVTMKVKTTLRETKIKPYENDRVQSFTIQIPLRLGEKYKHCEDYMCFFFRKIRAMIYLLYTKSNIRVFFEATCLSTYAKKKYRLTILILTFENK